MSDRLPRRRILRGLAAASTTALGGCASAIDRVGQSSEGSTDTEQVPGTATRETPSPRNHTPNEAVEESTQTRTPEGWSIDAVSIDPPANSFSSIPLPDDDAPYARMGSAADTATLYGNWKCPYTRAFVLDQLPGIVDEFVRSGDLSLEFQAVAYRGGEPFLGADAPRATRAGLGVWATDPDSFWQYFMYVFANQPHEKHRWAIPELLVRFATAAGVRDPEQIERAATADTYAEQVAQTVTNATRNDIWTVPRIVYDGEVTAPTVDPAQTREQLERARDQ